ncbi:DUF6624 domain-containing protein [Streptomyces sp. NPDC015125]|uniref:DUF6624 domain-containing protein n=1 Tax=Streptomyces sp. NPDC015125 TaxID=3364938 RepID=UPI0036FDF631
MAEPQRPDIARDLIDRAQEARGRRSKLFRALSHAEIGMGRHSDHANAQVLRRVIGDHGWPGRSMVGAEGADAAARIALHADTDPDFQRSALRLIAAAVESGEATSRQWAHLFDRCRVNAGHAQTYGTQYRISATSVELLPVHDAQHLDERRARLGLPPFATAQEAIRRRYARESGAEHALDDEPAQAEPLDAAA